MNDSPRFLLKSTRDALLIVEAAERGLFPRLVRRLTEKERSSYIHSGSVFVYDEFESGIRRFTDTMVWSPSRIVGNYLASTGRVSVELGFNRAMQVYRQMRKHEPRPTSRAAASLPPQPASMRSLARPRPDSIPSENEKSRKRLEQLYVGSLTNSDKFKPDGLIKRTFALMCEGKHIHVIAYYTYEDAMNERFETPSEHATFSELTISSDFLKDLSAYRVPPRVERLPNGQLAYAGEDFDSLELGPLEYDRHSPLGTSSTSESDVSSIPHTEASSAESSFDLPPLLPLRPVRTARQANPNWNDAPTLSASNYGGPAHTTVARSETAPYSFSNSSLAPISIPSLSPPPPRLTPRLRDVRSQQQPYPLRSIPRAPREPTNPPGEDTPPSYPWLLPVTPRSHENAVTVTVRPPPAYEVGPSGERVEYDVPEGRWTPNSGMVLLYSDAHGDSRSSRTSASREDSRYGYQQ